jgi:hypothetical protein
MQPFRPGLDDLTDWLAVADAEAERRRYDNSDLDDLSPDERARRLKIRRDNEASLAARPSPCERRLAEAVAASEAQAAARSTPERDALVLEVNAALGEQNSAIDGLRRAIVKLMVDERERAHRCEATLERRVAEFERAAGADQARIAGLERRLETAERRHQPVAELFRDVPPEGRFARRI